MTEHTYEYPMDDEPRRITGHHKARQVVEPIEISPRDKIALLLVLAGTIVLTLWAVSI